MVFGGATVVDSSFLYTEDVSNEDAEDKVLGVLGALA